MFQWTDAKIVRLKDVLLFPLRSVVNNSRLADDITEGGDVINITIEISEKHFQQPVAPMIQMYLDVMTCYKPLVVNVGLIYMQYKVLYLYCYSFSEYS